MSADPKQIPVDAIVNAVGTYLQGNFQNSGTTTVDDNTVWQYSVTMKVTQGGIYEESLTFTEIMSTTK